MYGITLTSPFPKVSADRAHHRPSNAPCVQWQIPVAFRRDVVNACAPRRGSLVETSEFFSDQLPVIRRLCAGVPCGGAGSETSVRSRNTDYHEEHDYYDSCTKRRRKLFHFQQRVAAVLCCRLLLVERCLCVRTCKIVLRRARVRLASCSTFFSMETPRRLATRSAAVVAVKTASPGLRSSNPNRRSSWRASHFFSPA